jgi:class 3 adenylate cyclase
VELNEQLDYFGQTVNVAARVQGLADGGEIVCTEDVWNAPGVQAQAKQVGLSRQRGLAQLKGVAGEVAVYRLRAS